ncbi:serine O-acetyltransferase [Rhodococcus ruber]|uniref:serine O-acetyltransferase n=1 Tax=Rhodococcus ruber TaxID=1830 RepID=UPI003783B337
MNVISTILQDFTANFGRPHIQMVLVLFRCSQTARGSSFKLVRLLVGLPMSAVYRLVALCGFGIDIPTGTRIGSGFAIHHGMGLVVHDRTVIGSGVTLRHCTTLGSKGKDGAPVIGNHVSIGPNSCVIGPIEVGAHSVVGAGSVVVANVPNEAVVAGNPARVIRMAR